MLTSRRFRPLLLLLLLLSGVAAVQPRHEEVEVEAVLALGPNSIEKLWLEIGLEKSLEFCLEIPYTKEIV